MHEQEAALRRELDAVQQSMRSSNNSLAGATRDLGLTQQMRAITQRYEIRAESDRAEVGTRAGRACNLVAALRTA